MLTSEWSRYDYMFHGDGIMLLDHKTKTNLYLEAGEKCKSFLEQVQPFLERLDSIYSLYWFDAEAIKDEELKISKIIMKHFAGTYE